LIETLLHQDVEDDAMLVHGTPQPLPLALDLELHSVEMPLVTRVTAPPSQSRGIRWAKLRAPGTNRLIRDDHSPFRQQLLHIAQAQVEAEIQPDGVADDLDWVSVAAIRWRSLASDGSVTRPSYPASPQLDGASERGGE
jgi:hypothetical protein